MSVSDSYPRDDIDFIVEAAVDGYEPDEISYRLMKEREVPISAPTVDEILSEPDIVDRMDVVRRVQEKNAEVSREELIRDLKETKSTLKDRAAHLRDNNLDEISNDTVKNILNSVKMLGEFIGELETKDGGDSGHVININNLEQNFNIVKSVQYLPAEDKNSVVEALKDDPEVEDFMIVRKDEAGYSGGVNNGSEESVELGKDI